MMASRRETLPIKALAADGTVAGRRIGGDRTTLPSGAPSKLGKPRLEGIQMCRGIAALLVLLFHTTQLSREKLGQPFLGNLFAFGDAGVDFFFVLSGFIIFFVHQGDIGHPDRIKPFILKRLIRIYPLYWLITLAILPLYVLAPQFGYGYERDLTVVVQSLLLVPQPHLPILIVGWSLSHEMLFYILFALAIVLPLKPFRWLLLGWFSGTAILLFGHLARGFDLEAHFLVQFIFNAHNFEFLFGCLSASLVLQKRLIRQSTFFLLLGISCFLLLGLAQTERSFVFSTILAYGFPSAFIVFGTAAGDLQRSRSVPRFFSLLGDASYSIYLTHYLCLSLLIKLAVAANLINRVGYPVTISLCISIALGAGFLTYAWLEQPLVNRLRQALFREITVNKQPTVGTANVTRSVDSADSKTAMKLLFLDQSGVLGGAELCLLDIVQPYRDHCLVCLFTDGPFRAALQAQKVPVKVLTAKPLQVRKESGLVQGLQSLSQLLPLAMTVAHLSRDYDLLYANTQKALVVGALASLISRRPLVYHLHDILSIDHFSKTNRRLAVTLANRCASQVIATSKASKDAFVAAGGRAELVAVVYNGFELPLHQHASETATQLRQQLGLSDRFVVGHFSRLSPWKGQHILLEALVHCADEVTAVFVGDALFGETDYVQTLKAQVDALGLQNRVRFLGFRSDIVPLMQACDVVAHTSTAPEPFGRVIVEAMLCGRPVIASASGGAVELVEPEVTGRLVPPGDVQALATAIAHYQKNPDATRAIAQTAQVQATERFNIKHIRQQIDQLLQAVVSNQRSTASGQRSLKTL